ncbi:hypothetical protein RINTHH_22330 [Richelia intracellularis HH01]|uniref:Uncharacterized protein n=1 Tax=Richelia intracellularis HH01 TaxID=1165094 RepID=M1X1P3_9NOST|nr:hypothetical protein RINTHH_22330 [Richelia intracellularis HH01]
MLINSHVDLLGLDSLLAIRNILSEYFCVYFKINREILPIL